MQELDCKTVKLIPHSSGQHNIGVLLAQSTCLLRVGKRWTEASPLVAALSPTLSSLVTVTGKRKPGELTGALPFFILEEHIPSSHSSVGRASHTPLAAQPGKGNLPRREPGISTP